MVTLASKKITKFQKAFGCMQKKNWCNYTKKLSLAVYKNTNLDVTERIYIILEAVSKSSMTNESYFTRETHLRHTFMGEDLIEC